MAKKKKEETEEITKSEAMQLALATIRKAHGDGAVMFGNADAIPGVEFRSTGCLGIDRVLGGGFGKGRIVELFGPEASGKSTLVLQTIAAAQKRGETAALVDMEHSFDPIYAQHLGVDLDNLVISQPTSGEEALQIVETLIGAVDVIAVDSVAALIPLAEIEKEIGQSSMGVQARLMSQAMRKMSPKADKADTTIIFINQIRMKIGCVAPETEVEWKIID